MTDTPQRRQSRLHGITQNLVIGMFAAAVLLDHSPRLLPSSLPLTIASQILCWIGVALCLLSVHTLRQVIQIEPAPREGGHLVTTGIYRWLRHPVYTGILIAVAGLVLNSPHLRVALAGLVVVAYLLVKVRFEERLLAQRYAGYRPYRARSLGIIPLWRG